jgi:hypothetical protein
VKLWDSYALDGDDGVIYEIRTTVDSVTIPKDATTAELATIATFYRKIGGNDPALYSCFGSAYRRYGTTYVRIGADSAKGNQYQIYSQVVSSDSSNANYADAIVFFMTEESLSGSDYANAAPTTYLAKKEIFVKKYGDTGPEGDDAINYYLTSNINSIIRDQYGNYAGTATPTITAWKKVGNSTPVRLNDIDTPSVAEGFVINAYEKSGDTIIYTNTSGTGVLSCLAPNSASDRFEVELVKGGKTYATMPIPIISEHQGEAGSDGVFPRDCGMFDADIATNQTFGYAGYIYRKVGDIVIRDMVRYQIGGVMYGFLVKTKSQSGLVTAAPASISNDANWECSGIVRTVIANTIFGTNANIGGFMASANNMISQNGSLTLDGLNGLIKLLHDNGYSWQVLPDGRQVCGIYTDDENFGEHIELDPLTKEIRIYDENGVCTMTINGREVSSISDIWGNNSGSVTLDSSYSNSSTSINNSTSYSVDNQSEKTRNLGNFSTTSATRIFVSGTLTAVGSKWERNSNTTGMTPFLDNYAEVTLQVITYSDSARTLVKKTTNIAKVSSLDSDTGYGTKTITLSNAAADLPSGYHTLRVLGYAIVFKDCVTVRSATASWNITASSYTSDIYLSRLMGNGLAFGTNLFNFFAALDITQNSVKRMFVKSMTEDNSQHKYGFLLDNSKGFQVLRPKGTTDAVAGCVFPTILYCYVSWTAVDTYSINTHFSFNGNNASVERRTIGEDGVMRVNFPTGFSELNLSLSKCIASVTAVTTECRNAHIYEFSSTYIDVECNDDTSNNYASFVLELRYIG